MFALTYDEYGDVDVLHLSETPECHAGPGEIRVKVQAASLNPMDWKIFRGLMSGGEPLKGPGQVGLDAAGVVDEIGEGVTGVSVGDDVFGLGSGTEAEYAVLHAWARKPASVDWAVASAAGVNVETSERALRLLDMSAGETLFVDGGAGGVGAVAVQMAVARGLTVIASASRDNHDYLREIGATPVLYGEGLTSRVREVAGGSVDAVFDVAGKTSADDLVALAPEPARVVTIANFEAAGSGIQVTGGDPDQSKPFEALAEGADLLQQNRLVIKTQIFPFDRAAEAYRISLSGHVRGKLVLVP